MTKRGKNRPYPRGKKKTSNKGNRRAATDETLQVPLGKWLFSSGPYSECPNCHKKALGHQMMGMGYGKYKMECISCDYDESHSLPEIKKKIIYLDQFVIDNIVKTLDKKHPKHEKAAADPFWLELYKKLDSLSKAQLIICPDSFYHQDESAPTGYFDSMQNVYEHLSGGVTFFHHDQIIERQILEHFKNYIRGNPDSRPSTNPEDIAFGKLHEWHNRLRISVGGKQKKEEIEEKQKSKEKQYVRFCDVFERWKTETNRTFEDWYKEEMNGFAKGTFLATKNFYERQQSAVDRYIQNQGQEEMDLNDWFPPHSVELLKKMRETALREGITETEITEKVTAYLYSQLDYIPTLRIGTALYAAIADQAAKGRKDPPSPGVSVDVEMISSLLPYCDAMFVDKENAALLEDGRVKKKIDCVTLVFSRRNKEAFLEYLDCIWVEADPSHMEFVKRVYGDDWTEPHITILENKEKDE